MCVHDNISSFNVASASALMIWRLSVDRGCKTTTLRSSGQLRDGLEGQALFSSKSREDGKTERSNKSGGTGVSSGQSMLHIARLIEDCGELSIDRQEAVLKK